MKKITYLLSLALIGSFAAHAETAFLVPPANDECDNPTTVIINNDFTNTLKTPGTLVDATASPQDPTTCFGTENNDVWFSFTATEVSHNIDVLNVTPSTNMYHSVWSGPCGNLTNVLCSNSNFSLVTGLIPGNVYLIRVNSVSDTDENTNFNISIRTPPQQPANDICSTAETIVIPENGVCTNIATTTYQANPDDEFTSCDPTGNHGVWYEFLAPSTGKMEFQSGIGNPGIVIYEGNNCGVQIEVPGSCQHNVSGSIDGLTPGNPYLAMVWTDVRSLVVEFCLFSLPPNDECTEAIGIPLNTDIDFDNTGATDSGADSCFTGDVSDLWYSFVAPASGEIAIIVGGDTQYALFSDCTTEVSCNTEINSVTPGDTYYVSVTDNGTNGPGPSTVNITDTSLSTTDFDSSLGFSYYPNPVKNTLILSANKAITSVAVFNMLGQEVIRTAPNAVSNNVDMSNLYSGAYFVQVSIGQAVETVRVIKN